MDNKNSRIRIGKIDYTNVWPVFHYFNADELRADIEIIEQVPSELNRAMAADQVDMGPISSFAYGQHAHEYVLFPDLSVSAHGNVNSIFLFSKLPIQDAANGRIALTNASATSVNLLKIILEKFYGGKPEYFTCKPDLEQMMEEADAALLIGDDAIRAGWRDTGYHRYDLGREWLTWTGRWMSFAVWAVRLNTVRSNPDTVGEVVAAFRESKRKSLARPEGMIAAARKRIGGTESYWRHYFSNLCYDFGEEQRTGLALYYHHCRELGLLPEEVSIQVWPNMPLMRVKE